MKLDELHAAVTKATDKYLGAVEFRHSIRHWLPDAATAAIEAELNRLAAEATAASQAYQQASSGTYAVVAEVFTLPLAA